MRDVHTARVSAWNSQPEHVRKARLGIHKGASIFEQHQRLPFPVPKGHSLKADGTLGPKAKRKVPSHLSRKRHG